MEQSEVILGFLVPADQEGAEAVEPGVAAFDHPSSCPRAGVALERLCLLTPGADMSGEPELFEKIADLAPVIVLIHAHALRLLGSGSGFLHLNVFESFPGELEES